MLLIYYRWLKYIRTYNTIMMSNNKQLPVYWLLYCLAPFYILLS